MTFDFNHNSTTLFDDEQTLKSICKLEWTLRTRFTNCSVSTNDACCQHIGPGRKNKVILYMFLWWSRTAYGYKRIKPCNPLQFIRWFQTKHLCLRKQSFRSILTRITCYVRIKDSLILLRRKKGRDHNNKGSNKRTPMMRIKYLLYQESIFMLWEWLIRSRYIFRMYHNLNF